MAILVGLVAIVLIVLLVGAMATGLGTILGFLSLFFHPRGQRLDPNRSRSIEEIQWDKTHRYPMPARRN